MTDRHLTRVALLSAVAVCGVAMSGCVSSPTYGTDKTAAEQLLDDVNNVASFAPKKNSIDYKPRPTLVKPAPGEQESLPPPQQDITQTASADWPESPEQKRARLRQEASAHINDTNFQAQIVDDNPNAKPTVDQPQWNGIPAGVPQLGHDRSPPWTPEDSSTSSRRAVLNKKLADQKQGDPTARRYLSDPPLAYRTPASTAPENDLGEDEAVKARRLKKEAMAKSGKSSWSDWLPSW